MDLSMASNCCQQTCCRDFSERKLLVCDELTQFTNNLDSGYWCILKIENSFA